MRGKPYTWTVMGELIYSLIRLHLISVISNPSFHLSALLSIKRTLLFSEFVKHDSFNFVPKFSQPVQRFTNRHEPEQKESVLMWPVPIWDSFLNTSWLIFFFLSSPSVPLIPCFPCIHRTTPNRLHGTATKNIAVKCSSWEFVCPAKFKLHSNIIQICSSDSLNLRRRIHLNRLSSFVYKWVKEINNEII